MYEGERGTTEHRWFMVVAMLHSGPRPNRYAAMIDRRPFMVSSMYWGPSLSTWYERGLQWGFIMEHAIDAWTAPFLESTNKYMLLAVPTLYYAGLCTSPYPANQKSSFFSHHRRHKRVGGR